MAIKELIRRVVPETAIAHVWRVKNFIKYRNSSPKEVFSKIYDKNEWSDTESVSGSGSTEEVTRIFRQELSDWLNRKLIESLVDVPCGDFNWMKLVKFPANMSYMGLDIVDAIIADNNAKYKSEEISFSVADVVSDRLPYADAYLCKDIFIHFPNSAIAKAVDNIRKSGCRFLLATTFPNTVTNLDIRFGSARRTNLEIMFGKADELLKDFGSEVHDRYIGVWQLN